MKPQYWNSACAHLKRNDPILKSIIKSRPGIHLRKRGGTFETLARAIVGQQISVKAAQSIWNRLVETVDRITPENVLKARTTALRKAGLSSMKVDYIRDLANHFKKRKIQPQKFRKLSNEELIEILSDVRGIGRWTAEMFLIFNLHREDVFPLDDLGLQKAIRNSYFKGKKVPRNKMEKLGEKWKPFRSVATWYLWRSLDPKPVEY